MFINTELFKTEAREFVKKGFYNRDPFGSPAWFDYWTEQLRRCTEGYSVGGVKITGDHYGYLNFNRIKLTTDDRKENVTKKRIIGKKILTFPDFWDGDYEYFWIKEIARNGISEENYNKLGLSVKIKLEHLVGGKNLCVAKARRKGFSYKNSWIATNVYNTIKDSVSIIAAYEKKYLYPKGTMSMVSDNLDFLNEKTGWAKKRDFINIREHKRASYKFTDERGNIIEKGFKSEVIALSFMDNPDAARGKDANLVLIEEGGVFDNLKASYSALEPLTRSGTVQTGQIILFGTGGDMEKGTIDFEDMFYDPESYNMIAVENKWDEDLNNTFCSHYFPDKKNKDGFIDKDGNSDEDGAERYEQIKRELLRKTAKDKKVLDRHIVEYSNKPKETFLRIKGNIFPIIDLQKILGTLEGKKDEQNYWIGNLIQNVDGKIEWEADSKLSPILDFPIKDKTRDTTGCVIIYEQPLEYPDGIPHGMYIAGIDPYDHDKSKTGSLGSTLIYNRLTKKIVAEYTARPETSKDYYEIVRRLLLYYNARALYENEKKGIFDYFEYKNCEYLLADQILCIKDVIPSSKVNRNKGMHMSTELKNYGEGLIKTYLIEQYNNESPDILNMHKIRSQGLLKELIAYDGEINTDRVMAFMMLMYYLLELRRYKFEEKKDNSKKIQNSKFFDLMRFRNK